MYVAHDANHGTAVLLCTFQYNFNFLIFQYFACFFSIYQYIMYALNLLIFQYFQIFPVFVFRIQYEILANPYTWRLWIHSRRMFIVIRDVYVLKFQGCNPIPPPGHWLKLEVTFFCIDLLGEIWVERHRHFDLHKGFINNQANEWCQT